MESEGAPMTTSAQTAVTTWARKAREALIKRDDAIRKMRAEGASLRAIAEAAGLTHTAIANITRGVEPTEVATPAHNEPKMGDLIEAIRRMRAEGASLRDVAEAAGLDDLEEAN